MLWYIKAERKHLESLMVWIRVLQPFLGATGTNKQKPRHDFNTTRMVEAKASQVGEREAQAVNQE